MTTSIRQTLKRPFCICKSSSVTSIDKALLPFASATIGDESFLFVISLFAVAHTARLKKELLKIK